MYNKYIKYKNKYVNIKNLYKMKGGSKLIDIPKSYMSSYDLLQILFKKNESITKDINVLIGAKNFNESDYNRFKDSLKYSLYIDSCNDMGKLILFNPDEIEKYDNMFTIFYEDIINDITSFPKNINILSFDFDVFVSNWVDREKYMNLMDSLLSINGEINFSHANVGGPIYFINNEDNSYYRYYLKGQGPPYINTKIIISHQEMIDKYKVNINNVDKSINVLDGFFETTVNSFVDRYRLLSPQLGFKIDNGNGDFFNSNINDEYLKYLKNKYKNYDISLCEYTYKKYTYVFPLKLHINDVPTLTYYIEFLKGSKDKYLNTGKFPDFCENQEVINTIIDKENYNKSMKENGNRRIFDNFQSDLLKDLNRKNYYYKLKKMS